MSNPTINGYKTLTQADIDKIRSTATATRQFSLGSSIPITQREGIMEAYGKLSAADKAKLLSALVTTAKNFVIGGSTNLNDRKKQGGSTDAGYKRRNTVWNEHVTLVKNFIASATKNSIVPSWDSIIINLQNDLKFEIYASFDNLYAPRFVAQTKLASYLEESEFIQLYQIRTAAARKLAVITPVTWEGATDTYAPILGDFTNLVNLVRSGDVKTCFLLSSIIDYMARYRYYKRQRSQTLREKFEKEAVFELMETAKYYKISFNGNETRREARIALSDALTKRKQLFVKKADDYVPFTKEKKLKDIGTLKPTLDDYIADFSDKTEEKKGAEPGIRMDGGGKAKEVITKMTDLLTEPIVTEDVKSEIPKSIPVVDLKAETLKTVTFTTAHADSLWKAMISLIEVNTWVDELIFQSKEVRGIKYKFFYEDAPNMMIDPKTQINETNYKSAMKWLSSQTDTTSAAYQKMGQALSKLDLIKPIQPFSGAPMAYVAKSIPRPKWATPMDTDQMTTAKQLMNGVHSIFNDSAIMYVVTDNETVMPLKLATRVSIFKYWKAINWDQVLMDPSWLIKDNYLALPADKIMKEVSIVTILDKMRGYKIPSITYT